MTPRERPPESRPPRSRSPEPSPRARRPFLGRTRTALAILLVAAWFLLAGAWLIGRLATDMSLQTQYLFWLPTPIVAGVGVVLCLLAWAWRPPARIARLGVRTGTVAVALMVAFLLVGEMRLGRGGGTIDQSTPPDSTTRVLSWNLGGDPLRDPLPEAASWHPDLAILANLSWKYRRPRPEALVGTPLEEAAWHHLGRFLILTPHPIARTGVVDLGLEATRRGDGQIDPGQAAFIEVTIDGSPRIVWLIDLPSDPSIPRHSMLRLAGLRIGHTEGGAGFPEPDLIVGDFNTPRGSRSLRNIVGDADSAFDRAGSGWSATWPRAFPLWHIDQVFVDDAVGVRAHRVLDMGLGEHRGVVVDVRWSR